MVLDESALACLSSREDVGAGSMEYAGDRADTHTHTHTHSLSLSNKTNKQNSNTQ